MFDNLGRMAMILAACAAMGLLFLASAPGALAAMSSTPQELISSALREAKAVAEDDGLDEAAKRARFRKIVRPLLHEQELARLALGRHWPRHRNRMSEFIPLFTELLEVRTITRHILEEARGAAIYVSPAKVDGLTATVPVLIRTRDGKEIPVEFRMVESGGGWLAYDLSIAGVSLISNYRAQFNQILSRDGATFDGLLKKIRERISRELERPTKAER